MGLYGEVRASMTNARPLTLSTRWLLPIALAMVRRARVASVVMIGRLRGGVGVPVSRLTRMGVDVALRAPIVQSSFVRCAAIVALHWGSVLAGVGGDVDISPLAGTTIVEVLCKSG